MEIPKSWYGLNFIDYDIVSGKGYYELRGEKYPVYGKGETGKCNSLIEAFLRIKNLENEIHPLYNYCSDVNRQRIYDNLRGIINEYIVNKFNGKLSNISDPQEKNEIIDLVNAYNSFTESILTEVPELNLNILAQLDDVSLTKICRVNKYAAKLCQDDNLWRKKFLMKVPWFDKLTKEKHYPDTSWKDLYIQIPFKGWNTNLLNFLKNTGRYILIDQLQIDNPGEYNFKLFSRDEIDKMWNSQKKYYLFVIFPNLSLFGILDDLILFIQNNYTTIVSPFEIETGMLTMIRSPISYFIKMISYNNIDEVERLIKEGVNEETILLGLRMAVITNNLEMFNLILNLYNTTKRTNTGILGTISNTKPNNLEMAKILLDRGVNINKLNGEILHRAIKSDNPSLVRLLLSYNPSVTYHNNEALVWARNHGYTDIVERLVELGGK